MAAEIEMLFGFWTWVGRMKWRRCGLMSNYFDHLLLFPTIRIPYNHNHKS